jgi:transmembrane sensor
LNEGKTILINDELIGRYLTGEALPDEAMALHEWLEKGENKAYFEAFEQAWQLALPSGKPIQADVEKDWDALKETFRKATPSRPSALRLTGTMRTLFRMAAVLAIGLGIGYYLFLKRPVDMVSTTATSGIEKIVFADSTVATLRKQAVISYPATFGKSRTVNLEKGEAFFKVTHNGAPFVVHTLVADIHVIGTAFNVTLWQGKLNVVVEEGKVLITTQRDSTYLGPGYSGSVVSDTTPIQVAAADDKNISSYATRKFVFKDTPLQDVFQVMQKAYPYTFSMENPGIGGCKITASFDDVSAEYMLHLIAESLNLAIKKNDQGFIIEGKGCP